MAVVRESSWLLLVVLLTGVQLTAACDGRHVFNSSYGIITDGVGEYHQASHCEWLIQASGSKQFITLDFNSMETECAYDYLFIYDGNSYTAPLLGSFSGGTLPDRVLAASGSMLIYFFSDRNYVRIGFNANYFITECPHNCSGHGDCNAAVHQCTCWEHYTGAACDSPICPDSCNGHGICKPTQGCDCNLGYIGSTCNIAVSSESSDVGGWATISPMGTGFIARAGHAGAYLPDKCLYVFGGNSLTVFLDDLMRFCVDVNSWEEIARSLPWPAARHGHAVAQYQNGFFMYGGIVENRSHSQELWYYNSSTRDWTNINTSGPIQPPGLASHTLTAVEDKWLYLFGGQKIDEEFISDIYRIDMEAIQEWERVDVVGGKISSRRLSGHSAVYHALSKTILVFGGFTPSYARFPKRTNLLHAFHVEDNVWSQINYGYADSMEPPLERAFHSATIIGNYMVIVGGNAHIHHRAEVCFDGDVYYYHLGCHRWILRDILEMPFRGSIKGESAPKGRYSHVAAAVFGNSIIVSGGYRGNVLGDLQLYTVPVSVSHNQFANRSHGPLCSLYVNYEHCIIDPECVWCTEPPSGIMPACINRIQAKECHGTVRSGDCPGICSALHDCASCTVLGQGTLQPLHPSWWTNEKCAWCVKEHVCQKRAEPYGACTAGVGTGRVTGWWGNTSLLLTAHPQCRVLDYPAGLHFIQYRYPPNFTNPDEVEIIRESREKFQFSNTCDAEVTLGGEFTVEFRGFIHPLGTPPYQPKASLQVYLIVAGGQGWLNMSTDHTVQHQEEVAALNAATYTYQPATRADNRPIFPAEERGRYYMAARCIQKIADRGTTQVSSVLRTEWTGKINNSEQSRQPLTFEFLEPFSRGNCADYVSCLACMTDSQCGWCGSSNVCVNREHGDASIDMCGMVEGAQHLIINHTDCTVCADHLDCHSCTQDGLCEWLISEARCMRRGRFPEALTDISMCPDPCYLRSNCSWCIEDENECAWCEQTRTCFPFMGYILRFNYGGCTNWVDSMSEQRCHDCSRHLNCKQCLTEYQCGWCGDVDDPTLGVCLHGDFTGPEDTSNCTAVVKDRYGSGVGSADWSYGVCPDVQECDLNYHDCHPNATCTNTFDSYLCTCNRGFQGDGKSVCDRTCYYDCVHGVCSGWPDYRCMCHVGWTGVDCQEDCACNKHSTCRKGVGFCDSCQNYTTGSHCQTCAVGSFGNATTQQGCVMCPCNGHADQTRGLCDRRTGECYCTHNTEGAHCELCKPGYYGDPTNGGRCYLRCEGRMIEGSVTSGSLGTHAGAGVSDLSHVYCLWIITVHEDFNNPPVIGVMPTITFTMESDIKTTCGKDFVYVFDGTPTFASSDPSEWAPLLAAYCGHHSAGGKSVEASSGFLTVFFQANMDATSSTRGFNGSYHVNACPSGCHGNHVCRSNNCDCQDGYGGVDCQVDLCPLHCSQAARQGKCDLELGQCVCQPGYGDLSCNTSITLDSTSYEPVHDQWRRDGIGAFRSARAVMGHTVVSCDRENIYMYGGYSYAHHTTRTTSLWKFNIVVNDWDAVDSLSSELPRDRYFHAAVCLPSQRAIYVFGGLVTDESGRVSTTNEMWRFSLENNRWSLLQTLPTTQGPVPPLAGHTLTRIHDDSIIVIGGFSPALYFNTNNYKFDAQTLQWTLLSTDGAKPTGLFGHTTVFHEKSDAVYVFGGQEYQADKTVASSNLYALDLIQSRWSLLPSLAGRKGTSQPLERFLHTAVSMDDYMVVIGGSSSEADFDDSVWAYKYNCNQWSNISPGVGGVLGWSLTALRGAAAIRMNDDVYVMGGYDGLIHATVSKIHLPYDICTVNVDVQSCQAMLGCAFCHVKDSNTSFCYDNSGTRPAGCLMENTTLDITEGISCQESLVTERDCRQHKTCSDCLTQWPIYRHHAKVCKWCSNCNQGMCMGLQEVCEEANPCQLTQQVIDHVNKCLERKCQAPGCQQCLASGGCIWTRQFRRYSEVGITLSLVPDFAWNCVEHKLLNATHKYNIASSPPMACPLHCHAYNNCSSCLSAEGGEGGFKKCYWSITANECMSPAYMSLRCATGSCGHVEVGQDMNCPVRCGQLTECSKCLARPGCGWCALGGMNGLGVCMEGGLNAPLQGACTTGNITTATQPLSDMQLLWIRQSTSPPVWAFIKCPKENECTNDHNICDQNEECIDQPVGYHCNCTLGFIRDSINRCRPHCPNGCEPHGTCVQPDLCQCHFGYVGHNCSKECQCNKHSNCPSVNQPAVCLSCLNHTQGAQCGMCERMFVGNPVDGGQCKPCSELCNHHTSFCLSQQDLNRTVLFNSLNADNIPNVLKLIHHGPSSEENAICINCQNNTMGTHCENCKPGFFRLNGQSVTQPCQKCQCHGHSDTCNMHTGTDCDCQNNTKSAKCDTTSPEIQCYKFQCAECDDTFLGTPTDGHQCYRQMAVDQEFCFDPSTQSNCYRDPSPLLFGRTVFFAVQPKYLNVHIRVTLDVSLGGVDVYLANQENAFVVSVDKQSGIHTVQADHAFFSEDLADIVAGRIRRSADLLPHLETDRRRRAVDNKQNHTPSNRSAPITDYKVRLLDAAGINTFVNVDNSRTLLVVRNLQHRLVITLPSHVHDLQKALFYITLRGVGSATSNMTTGQLFFRQDQAHIDLFVFFSVFFSTFFLFLDVCVLIWKIKQAFDSQRSRHQRQLEMECLASRPFGHVLIVTQDESVPTYDSVSLLTTRKTSRRLIPKLASKYSLGASNMAFMRSTTDDTFHINPLALEPTDDGIAAVGTFIMELPGGREVPERMCVGSTLLTMRLMFPTNHPTNQTLKSHRPEHRERCPSGHMVFTSGTM